MSAIKKYHISDVIVAYDAHLIFSNVLHVKVFEISLIFSHFHSVNIFLDITPKPPTEKDSANNQRTNLHIFLINKILVISEDLTFRSS